MLDEGKIIGEAFGSKVTSDWRTMNKNTEIPQIKRKFQGELFACKTGDNGIIARSD